MTQSRKLVVSSFFHSKLLCKCFYQKFSQHSFCQGQANFLAVRNQLFEKKTTYAGSGNKDKFIFLPTSPLILTSIPQSL